MPTLPRPELPPPDTPDSHKPNPGDGSVRTPHGEPASQPPSATVRLRPVDPAADTNEIITAAVSMITTTYTSPGDRIMLADLENPATGSRRTRRDRLVESVLRLGRGATTDPDFRPHSDHQSSAAAGGLSSDSGCGSGLGLRPGDLAEPVANSTERQSPGEYSGPSSDDFALIIAGWSEQSVDPFAMVDFTLGLASAGTLVVLTHSSDARRVRAGHSARLSRAAASAGLILSDQLTPVRESPAVSRPTDPCKRRDIDLGGHRRIHTTSPVFRRWESALEANLDLAGPVNTAILLDSVDDPRAAELPGAADLVLTGLRHIPRSDSIRTLVRLYEDLDAVADWILPGKIHNVAAHPIGRRHETPQRGFA